MGAPKDPPKPRKPKPRTPGEQWLLLDGRVVMFVKDLPSGFLSAINEQGMLETVHESMIKEKYAKPLA